MKHETGLRVRLAVDDDAPHPREVVESDVVEFDRISGGIECAGDLGFEAPRDVAEPDRRYASVSAERLGQETCRVREVEQCGARGFALDDVGDPQGHGDRPQGVRETADPDRLLADEPELPAEQFVAMPGGHAPDPYLRHDVGRPADAVGEVVGAGPDLGQEPQGVSPDRHQRARRRPRRGRSGGLRSDAG